MQRWSVPISISNGSPGRAAHASCTCPSPLLLPPPPPPFQVQPVEALCVAGVRHRHGDHCLDLDRTHDHLHDHPAGGDALPERVLPVVRQVVPALRGAVGGDLLALPPGRLRQGLLQVRAPASVVHAAPHEAQRHLHELVPLQLRVSGEGEGQGERLVPDVLQPSFAGQVVKMGVNPRPRGTAVTQRRLRWFLLLVFYILLCSAAGEGTRSFCVSSTSSLARVIFSLLLPRRIILMCTSPVIQFTVQALSAYLRNTEVTNFFNVQVRA